MSWLLDGQCRCLAVRLYDHCLPFLYAIDADLTAWCTKTGTTTVVVLLKLRVLVPDVGRLLDSRSSLPQIVNDGISSEIRIY